MDHSLITPAVDQSFQAHLNSRKLLFKRDLMSTAVIKINPSEMAGSLFMVPGR